MVEDDDIDEEEGEEQVTESLPSRIRFERGLGKLWTDVEQDFKRTGPYKTAQKPLPSYVYPLVRKVFDALRDRGIVTSEGWIEPTTRAPGVEAAPGGLYEALIWYLEKYQGTTEDAGIKHISEESFWTQARYVSAFLVWLYRELGNTPLTLQMMNAPSEPGGMVSLTGVEQFAREVTAGKPKGVHTSIKNFIHDGLFDRGYLRRSDLGSLYTSAGTPEESKGVPLSWVEVKYLFTRLLLGLDPQYRVYFRYLLQTGLRPKHAVRLRLADLLISDAQQERPDCTNEKFHRLPARSFFLAYNVRNKKKTSSLKGVPEYAYVSDDVYRELVRLGQEQLEKNKLDPAFAAEFPTLKKQREATYVWPEKTPDAYKTTIDARRKNYEKWDLTEDLKEKLIPYSMRKTWATVVYYCTGKDIKRVAEMGGWAKPDIPFSTYIQSMSEDDAYQIKTHCKIFVPPDCETAFEEMQGRVAGRRLKDTIRETLQTDPGALSKVYGMLQAAGVPKDTWTPLVKSVARESGLDIEIPEGAEERVLSITDQLESLQTKLDRSQREVQKTRDICMDASEESIKTVIASLTDRLGWEVQKGRKKKLPPLPENSEELLKETMQAMSDNMQKQFDLKAKEFEGRKHL